MPESDAGAEGRGKGARRTALLVSAALGALAVVSMLGWYQFNHRAASPIDMVRARAVHGTDATIGEVILEFVKDRGTEVTVENFTPSWGAEETGEGVWVVSYVFEEGRRSRWVSWRVHTGSGKLVPLDAVARELLEGDLPD